MNNISVAPNAAVSPQTDLRSRVAAAGLDWIVPDWPAPAHVNAMTTTRSSPAVQAAPHASLDRVAGDKATHAAAPFLPSEPLFLQQVHGAAVAVLDERSLAGARRSPPVADAAVTRLTGVVCVVATADCLPVVLTDRKGETIGVAHAGWRGLAAGVLAQSVSAMRTLGADASQLMAWLGPAIGPRAFEIGSDVFDAFCANDAACEPCFAPYREGKWLADIYALARLQLERCDVRDISGGNWCTYSESARFHSYRRERATGRMLTLAWLEPCTALSS